MNATGNAGFSIVNRSAHSLHSITLHSWQSASLHRSWAYFPIQFMNRVSLIYQ